MLGPRAGRPGHRPFGGARRAGGAGTRAEGERSGCARRPNFPPALRCAVPAVRAPRRRSDRTRAAADRSLAAPALSASGRCPPGGALRAVPSGRCPPGGALRAVPSGRCPPGGALRAVPSGRCPPGGALRAVPSGRTARSRASSRAVRERQPAGDAAEPLRGGVRSGERQRARHGTTVRGEDCPSDRRRAAPLRSRAPQPRPHGFTAAAREPALSGADAPAAKRCPGRPACSRRVGPNRIEGAVPRAARAPALACP